MGVVRALVAGDAAREREHAACSVERGRCSESESEDGEETETETEATSREMTKDEESVVRGGRRWQRNQGESECTAEWLTLGSVLRVD